ncbi:MAG: aspartate kinase [Thaumarchaeota archaeon]|nr:aspartate kinase [Nitrososphaerota archaeon]
MKFGGSLLASEEGVCRVADLLEDRPTGSQVVGVVSALRGVTDSILDLAMASPFRGGGETDSIIDSLRSLHEEAVYGTSLGRMGRSKLLTGINGILGQTRRALEGARAQGPVSPKTLDLVASMGERIAALIVAAEMDARGFEAPCLTGGEAGIITNDAYGNALPDLRATKKAAWEALTPRLDRGEIPIVTGFVGRSKLGETTTLGRGGSDYTATILANSLLAREALFWTDSDGIRTGDPGIVEGSQTVRNLSFNEASELAFFGAKRLHPRTIEPAKAGLIPIRIKNGFHPDSEGTLISAENNTDGAVKAVAAKSHMTPLAARASSLGYKETLGVETDSDAVLIGAVGDGIGTREEVAAAVFGALAGRGILAEPFPRSSRSSISFVVKRNSADQAVKAVHDLIVLPGLTEATTQRVPR